MLSVRLESTVSSIGVPRWKRTEYLSNVPASPLPGFVSVMRHDESSCDGEFYFYFTPTTRTESINKRREPFTTKSI